MIVSADLVHMNPFWIHPHYLTLKQSNIKARTLKQVNETTIDHLEGILERLNHPPYPEPDVALLFRKNEFDNVQAEVGRMNIYILATHNSL